MITIKDIARIAGVSHTTVSRALNNNPIIKKETREKIQAIAEELNYVPNPNARNLVMQKSYTIGLFFSSIDAGTSSSFLVDVLKAVNHVLDDQYNVVVRGIDSIKDLDAIVSQRFDGIIVMSQSDEDNQFIYHVKQMKIPLVVLNRPIEDPTISNVIDNDRLGVKEAIDYAISLGHRKIAIIEGQKGFRSALERKEGYLDSLKANQLTINPDYMKQGDYSIESGFSKMNELIDLPEHSRPTLVFCSNDDMAMGAINACYQRNIRIPNDISLLGFDNLVFSRYTTPPLTTVGRPIYEISTKGTELLLHLIEHPDTSAEQIVVNTEFIKRETLKEI